MIQVRNLSFTYTKTKKKAILDIRFQFISRLASGGFFHLIGFH